MYTFLKFPNLPQGNVSHVITADDDALSQSLSRHGVNSLNVSENPQLQVSVASHTDMLCNYLGNGNILLDKTQTKLFNELTKLGLKAEYISEDLSKSYPNDILLNCTILKNKAICNKKYISNELLDFFYKNNYAIIDVKQGYAKCSVCVVNENAIITDDTGIAKNSKTAGVDVLLIEKGDIYLNNCNYGFIGGCSGLIGKNKLAFYGNIKNHKNSNEIFSFLKKYGVEAISLTDEKLIDVGGIIPICEIK